MTLYEYSQVCYIVETLVFSFTLMHIGNGKVCNTHWLKRAKWMVTSVLALVGIITAVVYSFNMSTNQTEAYIALTITKLYLATYLLSLAFIPLADTFLLTRTRLLISILIIIVSLLLIWSTIWPNPLLSQIFTIASMALYLIELMRVILVFLYNYRELGKQKRLPGSDDETRYNCLDMVVRSICLLAFIAVCYLFSLLFNDKYETVHNFGMLFVWAYLFVTFVNLIINYNPHAELAIDIIYKAQKENNHNVPHPEISSKVDKWVNDGHFSQQGITLLQVADEIGTNRSYLSEHINGRYGCNFNTWLTKLRIEEAKRQMASSPTLSLDKIAVAVGFASKSHFMNSFKNIEGVTPGQWRQQNV